ncbi:MAG TPA: HAMP domain-containing sensor histidine kinase [Enhygromyxa sp.]|nr:HAMP domain-containing sensor histidine kinase [Enhygromyxa sp.]
MLVITGAVILMLIGMVQVTAVLQTLAEQELEALNEEGYLHRAAWTLDVSMRHGEADCRTGTPSGPTRSRIADSAARLDLSLTSATDVTPPMRELAAGYLDLATRMQEREGCEGLLDKTLLRRRADLDEQLTNVWVSRLAELHQQVSVKDLRARKLGTRTAIAGIVLAGLSSVLAALLAGRSARILTRALANLTEVTRRVGRGDLSTPVSIGDGPSELVDLAEEFARMRLQLQELEALKQGILASISHELRTPLSKIRESLALLHDGVVGDVDPRQRQVVEIARRACESEIRMVTTLLDLTRLRAGSPVRMRNGVNLDGVIENAIDDERGQADERGVRVEFETVGELPTGSLDPVLVERAIANLIRNSIAVSKRGQQVLIRRVVTRERPGWSAGSCTSSGETTWACVTIHDQGPGVPVEIRESLFEAFVTRAVPSSSKGLGFGLGLALAREIARAHGGELELDDDVEIGATFRLWLLLGPRPPTSPVSNGRRSLGLDPDFSSS